ncbi:atrial natriuretic peptide receptor 1 [Sinocyclocheilus anshuiensis]|uniref:atrial natriuretic peptide receptor 1 n=1 Tax=Sinocyclocheilus anshuiensis TaxID=1608454 RepID=UPI0007B890F3|nr:PREDICTED: atrial natriuretic peptide receptor 1-like [Sinocyclocheilus anshuiensis]
MRSHCICMVCFVLCVFGWHDLDNSEYDCWPLEKPDELNMIDCGGLEMAWVLRPPEKVLSGEDFSVIYSVTVRDEFYQWAIDNDIFIHRSITDPAEARRFCEQHECPADWKDASGENCCIHHANIHSCPMGFMKQAEERICGPWIPDDGRIFTHTISTSGKISQTNWSAKVVLFHEGLTSLIAHIRVGNMQVALEAKSTVLPAISTVSVCALACVECTLPLKALGDGRTVAIKKIKTKTFSLSKTIRQEVKQVRELDHPNLCKFFGGCVEVPNVAIITEYCPKGSLNDVLLNDEIPLNWGFRFSFATDIARGMLYLHQFKICHGRLKSANCVIDDRWVCKIADYCLWMFRREDCAEPLTTYQQRLKEVYTPPEAQSGSQEPTLARDVFSYSIILLEIATRNDPVPAEDSSLECGWCPPLPELISGKADSTCPCPAEYAELIRRCRAHNPAHRPTFEQIRKFVNRINPHKVSPVDMMMELMEKYSKHLEVLVGERTQDLMLEKQKTDRLLYSMLPKQVADDLRQGKPLQAQSYVSATVFFSDIVGFTQLSSTSTPYQVVDFLNKLYTTFDEIIDNHDVYKVETIGDAYMVVSGVPRENGILHASEIASMALDLVSVCKTFRIPHRPQTQLQIRAGIHSGPVVAGVVGTKMPRYCLFGDTVNTASRMESTSEALKTQCSSSAFYLLEEIGGYVLTCRGVLQVKGKGDMVTYWLEGKRAAAPAKDARNPETHTDDYSSIPGVLSGSDSADLLCDP